MRTVRLVRSTAIWIGLLSAALFSSSARAEDARLSISGYDPVAYFTDGKPVPGSSEFEYVWHGSRWRFASAAHRDLFIKDPDHYAPQYDGYCALGASIEGAAHKDTVDPNAWAIVDGKLYLVHNRHALQVWQKHAEDHIKQANRDWQIVRNLAGPQIIGPPCAASPPTAKLTLRDGGHMVAVGAQVARDPAGNIIGQGDLERQIEQVGQNVDACLAAGGATVKDIAFTVSYVKDSAAAGFDKYADLRQRYFGPPFTTKHHRIHAAGERPGSIGAGRSVRKDPLTEPSSWCATQDRSVSHSKPCPDQSDEA